LIFFFLYGNLKTRGIASVAELSQRAREIPGPLILSHCQFHPDLPAIQTEKTIFFCIKFLFDKHEKITEKSRLARFRGRNSFFL